MEFFLEKTEVWFTAIERSFDISAVFCTIDLPFSESVITVRWYGVLIAFGYILAALFGGRIAYTWKIDLNKMVDILIYGSLGGIIGARLYYCLSKWEVYSENPLSMLYIWEGGLAIWGGIIGGLIGGLITCKVNKINIRNLLDMVGMSLLIGQGIGRWGNFANQEAFGTNTTLPWGMYSQKTYNYLAYVISQGAVNGSEDPVIASLDPTKPVHPTFLYESLWCLLGFLILYITLKKARKFSGQLFLMYGVWYGTGRTIIEGFRTDSLYIGNTTLRTSQVLSLAVALVCAVALIVLLIKYIRHPQPIEGIDYIVGDPPVYWKKQKEKKAAKLAAANNVPPVEDIQEDVKENETE
ncbi:MAG: prolipoprotein diacylglyceryl transferase [Clostridia bacterium]|nr:prolipoprotein diacylglyceryl transferase [Clostridia bacterium]